MKFGDRYRLQVKLQGQPEFLTVNTMFAEQQDGADTPQASTKRTLDNLKIKRQQWANYFPVDADYRIV